MNQPSGVKVYIIETVIVCTHANKRTCTFVFNKTKQKLFLTMGHLFTTVFKKFDSKTPNLMVSYTCMY